MSMKKSDVVKNIERKVCLENIVGEHVNLIKKVNVFVEKKENISDSVFDNVVDIKPVVSEIVVENEFDNNLVKNGVAKKFDESDLIDMKKKLSIIESD